MSLPVVFWAPASQYQIAHWVKEKKSEGGFVTQPEEPLRFRDNVYVAETKKEVDFIKNSKGFKNGTIKECESVRQAAIFTRQQDRLKQATTKRIDEGVSQVDEEVTMPDGNPLPAEPVEAE